jgi:hypothetical protein
MNLGRWSLVSKYEIRDPYQMWALGRTTSGSLRLRALKQTKSNPSAGGAGCFPNTGEPQVGQKYRTQWSEDAKPVRLPAMIRKALAGALAQTTRGDPLKRRQMVQWQ